jgi:hypothetical protein
MRRASGLAVVSAITVVWACRSGGGNQPPPTEDDFTHEGPVDAGAERDGGAYSDANGDGSVAATDAGSADATSDGNVLSGLKSTGDGSADADPLLPPQCPTGHTWTAGAEQVSDAIARFGGIAATGLTAAWMRTSGYTVAADRARVAAGFSTMSFLLPSSALGTRPALDATGTLMLAIDSGGLYTQYWQRPDTQSTWQLSSAATTPFDAILHALGQATATWSEPAFGASGDRIFYLVTPPEIAEDGGPAGGLPVLYESQWDAKSSGWTAGVPLPNAEFASTDASHRRRPTGASADDLTLFFYDEVTGIERAAWRVAATAGFDHFEDISVAPEAAPNLDCSALYYLGGDADAAPDAGGGGIYIAE